MVERWYRVYWVGNEHQASQRLAVAAMEASQYRWATSSLAASYSYRWAAGSLAAGGSYRWATGSLAAGGNCRWATRLAGCIGYVGHPGKRIS